MALVGLCCAWGLLCRSTQEDHQEEELPLAETDNADMELEKELEEMIAFFVAQNEAASPKRAREDDDSDSSSSSSSQSRTGSRTKKSRISSADEDKEDHSPAPPPRPG